MTNTKSFKKSEMVKHVKWEVGVSFPQCRRMKVSFLLQTDVNTPYC